MSTPFVMANPEELPKSFEPDEIEARWYAQWESRGYFQGGQHVASPTGQSQPFVIQFPPPNVTGTLHMGHAFNQTIMDGLIRYRRMRGDDTVFVRSEEHMSELQSRPHLVCRLLL